MHLLFLDKTFLEIENLQSLHVPSIHHYHCEIKQNFNEMLYFFFSFAFFLPFSRFVKKYLQNSAKIYYYQAMRKVLLLALSLISLAAHASVFESINKINKKSPIEVFLAKKQILAFEAYLDSLTEIQKASQVFLVNVEGSKNYHPVEYIEQEILVPGGYIFFAFNIASDAQGVMDFTNSIVTYCRDNSAIQPYLSLDQEGGGVNRLRGITSAFPSAYAVSHSLNVEQALEFYNAQALQMKSLGFEMNLSPVAEPLNSQNMSFLGNRSFGSADKTVDFASAQIVAFQNKGVSCVAKHFPGNTNTDPHTGLPVINAAGAKLDETFIEPFRKILAASPDAVLLSHAVVTSRDSKPADLSSYWCKEILRGQMKYEGLLMSDDLLMGALTFNGFPPEKAVVQAIASGIDVIMLCQKQYRDLLEIVIQCTHEDEEFKMELERAVRNVIMYKIKKGLLNFEKQDDGTLMLKGTYKINGPREMELFNSEYQKGSGFKIQEMWQDEAE